MTQFGPQNPYRRVRPIGDKKGAIVDENWTLSIRNFLVVYVDGTFLIEQFKGILLVGIEMMKTTVSCL
jgi:hypothetical protein